MVWLLTLYGRHGMVGRQFSKLWQRKLFSFAFYLGRKTAYQPSHPTITPKPYKNFVI